MRAPGPAHTSPRPFSFMSRGTESDISFQDGLFVGGLKLGASSPLIMCSAELYPQPHSEIYFPYASWFLVADSAQLMPCWGNSDSGGPCRILPGPLGMVLWKV